jgi:hypothetical protein
MADRRMSLQPSTLKRTNVCRPSNAFTELFGVASNRLQMGIRRLSNKRPMKTAKSPKHLQPSKDLQKTFRKANLQPSPAIYVMAGSEGSDEGKHLHTNQAMTSVVAIDPGASGGLAWSHGNGVCAAPAPATEGDYVDTLRDILTAATLEGGTLTAFVERVGGFIGKQQPGSAMFKFGFGCGVIEGALRALGIATVYVRPQEWQRTFSLGTARSCASKTVWKNKLKAEAQRRFPKIKVTLATSDALLILAHATKERTV